MDKQSFFQEAEKLASRSTYTTIGSVLSLIVADMCKEISQRIKAHETPLKSGLFKKPPFKIKRDQLIYELTHLCIYSGHIAFQTAIPTEYFKLNVDLYYETFFADPSLERVLVTNQGIDHEKRYSRYADIVIKSLEKKSNAQQIAERIEFVFCNFYYTNGDSIGVPNGLNEDLFIKGLVNKFFVMPCSFYRHAISLLNT